MALLDTNLILQGAPLPVDFNGSPQDLFAEFIRRTKIVSPSGTNFFFVGDTEPTSNVGPWLKGGTMWFVWDEDLNRYVPLDISESETRWFHVGATTPSTSTPPVWLRTTQDQTEGDGAIGDPIGWYVFNGTFWVPYNSIVNSGTTEQRPAAPVDFQQYYDSTITCLIWWERSQWRTVSGVPGDVKAVAFEILTEALSRNPGWELLGAGAQSFRGRYISQATKDSGATPATDLTTSAGVAHRAAFETFGETDGVQLDSGSPVPYPPTIALWHLVKT